MPTLPTSCSSAARAISSSSSPLSPRRRPTRAASARDLRRMLVELGLLGAQRAQKHLAGLAARAARPAALVGIHPLVGEPERAVELSASWGSSTTPSDAAIVKSAPVSVSAAAARAISSCGSIPSELQVGAELVAPQPVGPPDAVDGAS